MTNRLLRAPLKFRKSKRQLALKLISLRLNTRPYNKLDKEVIDFKEYKEGLATQHNTKYFYYQDRWNKDKEY